MEKALLPSEILEELQIKLNGKLNVLGLEHNVIIHSIDESALNFEFSLYKRYTFEPSESLEQKSHEVVSNFLSHWTNTHLKGIYR